jgi:hypothetical protein
MTTEIDAAGRKLIPWPDNSLIDLAEIADAVKGAWFFGIYDTQFTAPMISEELDGLLQKHVDSVRPIPAPATAADQPRAEALPPEAAPRGAIAARQVHLWFEGKLKQSRETFNPCLDSDEKKQPSAASPLASAVSVSPEKFQSGTYRRWLTALAESSCLDEDGGAVGMLVAQGDLDVPFLASGDGAELVSYFQTGAAKDELNLLAAAAVARDANKDFPGTLNRLSLSALLIALIEHGADSAELLGTGPRLQDWFEEAERTLELDAGSNKAGPAEALNPEASLEPLRVELLSRLHLMKDEADKARDVLMDASPDVLAQRNLAIRLARIADEALKRQPTEILGQVAAKIQGVSDDTAAKKSAASAIANLVNQERQRQGEPYRIGLPEAQSSP